MTSRRDFLKSVLKISAAAVAVAACPALAKNFASQTFNNVYELGPVQTGVVPPIAASLADLERVMAELWASYAARPSHIYVDEASYRRLVEHLTQDIDPRQFSEVIVSGIPVHVVPPIDLDEHTALVYRPIQY